MVQGKEATQTASLGAVDANRETTKTGIRGLKELLRAEHERLLALVQGLRGADRERLTRKIVALEADLALS